jgi:FkbM family methyltransferase
MIAFIKRVLLKTAHSLGYNISKVDFVKLIEVEKNNAISTLNRINFLIGHSDLAKDDQGILSFCEYSENDLLKSKAQIFQDLFVLYTLKNKRNGFFVEFGATDGVSLSNTFLLEKEYGWKGIVAEPAHVWIERLKENRKCFIDTRCVWSKSGETLAFYETRNAVLSTIDMYSNYDFLADSREDRNEYSVETISLNDLLSFYNAPPIIDYMSIDTEGSEWDILSSFNFSKYFIRIITVEHNFSAKREDIFNLLTVNGYKRVFQSISLFDDFYIHEKELNEK